MAPFTLSLNLVVLLFAFSYSLVRDYKTCLDHYNGGHRESGVQSLYVKQKQLEVFCDQDTDEGGWVVIQRRKPTPDGERILFYRNWNNYKEGFGDLKEEFWLGLENIYTLTQETPFVLRIDLEDWKGTKKWAKYKNFSISGADHKYRLSLGKYEGNAGDSLTYHNGEMFSTFDSDNDKSENSNCAKSYTGAWWYKSCLQSNLNGDHYKRSDSLLGKGIVWEKFRGSVYSLKATQMAIRPY